MPLFWRKTAAPPQTPPAGLGAGDIRITRSTCTGERLIGFYQPATGKLLAAVPLRTPADLKAFYTAYGYPPPAAEPKEL